MAIEQLPRLEYSQSQKGAVYGKTFTLAAEAVSNDIILPTTQIYAMGVQIGATSDIKIEATMASTEEIEADEAIWDTWDGASLFNLAVTAIRGTNNSTEAEGTFTLTVKGEI